MPKTFVAGEVLTAADVNRYLNNIEHAYNEFTAFVTISATTDATANTVVTASAFTSDATAVMIEFFTPEVRAPAVAGDGIIISLFQDGVSLGYLAKVGTPAAGAMGVPVLARRRLTPASGSRTYSVRAWRTNATNGEVGAGAGGAGLYGPGYIRITKV